MLRLGEVQFNFIYNFNVPYKKADNIGKSIHFL